MPIKLFLISLLFITFICSCTTLHLHDTNTNQTDIRYTRVENSFAWQKDWDYSKGYGKDVYKVVCDVRKLQKKVVYRDPIKLANDLKTLRSRDSILIESFTKKTVKSYLRHSHDSFIIIGCDNLEPALDTLWTRYKKERHYIELDTFVSYYYITVSVINSSKMGGDPNPDTLESNLYLVNDYYYSEPKNFLLSHLERRINRVPFATSFISNLDEMTQYVYPKIRFSREFADKYGYLQYLQYFEKMWGVHFQIDSIRLGEKRTYLQQKKPRELHFNDCNNSYTLIMTEHSKIKKNEDPFYFKRKRLPQARPFHAYELGNIEPIGFGHIVAGWLIDYQDICITNYENLPPYNIDVDINLKPIRDLPREDALKYLKEEYGIMVAKNVVQDD